MRDRALDPQRLDLRVGEDVPDAVDGAAGNAGLDHHFEPFAAGFGAQGCGDQFVQRFLVAPA